MKWFGEGERENGCTWLAAALTQPFLRVPHSPLPHLSVCTGEIAIRVEALYNPYHESLKAVHEAVLPKTVLSCHRCGSPARRSLPQPALAATSVWPAWCARATPVPVGCIAHFRVSLSPPFDVNFSARQLHARV